MIDLSAAHLRFRYGSTGAHSSCPPTYPQLSWSSHPFTARGGQVMRLGEPCLCRTYRSQQQRCPYRHDLDHEWYHGTRQGQSVFLDPGELQGNRERCSRCSSRRRWLGTSRHNMGRQEDSSHTCHCPGNNRRICRTRNYQGCTLCMPSGHHSGSRHSDPSGRMSKCRGCWTSPLL